MNSSKIALFSVLGVLVLGVLWFISAGNGLIALDEKTSSAWAQVENVYQRRADLVPNLVETVKGYAKHEAEVLEQVTQARASVGQIKVNSPDDLKKFDSAQGQLSSALSRLMVVAEKYPDLKANKNFSDLQVQLEGTENRIAVERRSFNDVAREYNTAIRQFPGSFVAGMKGLKERAYFEAQKGADKPPAVKF
ncbi:MAG: LemA family protein [Bdellovibrionales bacterium]|nr:LemA family protein [Bdellovibrionales bacterium]